LYNTRQAYVPKLKSRKLMVKSYSLLQYIPLAHITLHICALSPSGAMVKERVKLQLYYPSWPSLPVLG